MRIKIHDDAEQDLINGKIFYGSQNSQIGDYFLETLYSEIDSLLLFAGIHIRQHGYHRFLSKRFP